MDATTSSRKLPAWTKLTLGLGTVAFGIKDQGFNLLLMLYYNQVVGLPATWVGAAIMAAMVVDAFADPLIGHWSDGFESRWGRRHPFMYAAALPVAILYFLLWSPPAAAPWVQTAYLLVTSVGVRVAISFYEIPSYALTTELTTDYDERTSLATYRALCYALGFVGLSVITFKTVMEATPANPVGQLNAAGYVRYGALAAPLMFLCVLVGTAGTHNRIPQLRQSKPDANRGMRALMHELRVVFFDRTLASLLLCALFFAIVGGLANTLGTYMFTYFWRFTPAQIGTVTGAGVGGMVLAAVIAQVAKRFDKKNVAMLLYAGAIVAYTLPVVLALLHLMPTAPAATLGLIALQYMLMLMCVIAGLILITSMLADVGDYFRLKTGQRMEGLMFAALVMINKAVSGLGVFLSGLVLSLIGFPEKADPANLPAGVVDRLGWAYVISIGGFCGLAVLCLAFYPISRARHRQILTELGEAPAA